MNKCKRCKNYNAYTSTCYPHSDLCERKYKLTAGDLMISFDCPFFRTKYIKNYQKGGFNKNEIERNVIYSNFQ